MSGPLAGALHDAFDEIEAAVKFIPVLSVKAMADSHEEPGLFGLQQFEQEGDLFIGAEGDGLTGGWVHRFTFTGARKILFHCPAARIATPGQKQHEQREREADIVGNRAGRCAGEMHGFEMSDENAQQCFDD